MSPRANAAIASIGFVFLIACAFAAEAAEVKVISAGGFRPVLSVVGPRFEHATGHKLTIKFVDGPAVKGEIDAGAALDVVVSLSPAMDDLVAQGKIVAATRANIARRGVGVGVAVGAPKPDIGSVEAVKRTLLAAKTVAHSSGGSAGVYFKSLLDRLGIAEQMKAKLKPMPGSTAAETIVNGEADLLVAGNAETMVPGVQPVGLLPPELQDYIMFAAGVVAGTPQLEAAKALLKFLKTPEAGLVIKAKGMEPVVP